MPIYAYRCSTCGHAQDVLQKLSDELLTVCPACGAATYSKQLTAAGFQLKGSGWYVTDFKNGNAPAPKKEGDAKDAGDANDKSAAADATTATADTAGGDKAAAKSVDTSAGAAPVKPADKPAPAPPSPSAAPAAAS